ncbi:MAG: aspartate--tRNA ligase [Flavobacteriaceae bacterium]|nr:aspartate--tRNA ligase [Flavobacteriaceae bacterium]
MSQPSKYRTHHCGRLNTCHIGQRVLLCGWVHRIRDKGFITWIELRDFYGIVQLVFDQERTAKKTYKEIKYLNREDVIQIEGMVLKRESANRSIPSGEVEVLVETISLLNKSSPPPFTIEKQTDGGPELRMQYRYLDIRRQPIRDNLVFRHQLVQSIREFLWKNEYLEIETPFLIKSTPEGARDFIVSSYMNKGQHYALPQSPQTLKQLLMIGGIDKYFQIVKCFRDEDLRADRQPEFTQLDCELSFASQHEIMEQFERLLGHLLEKFTDYRLRPFQRLTYDQAINNYGTDKPDLRFGMKLADFTQLTRSSGFAVFDSQETVAGFSVQNGSGTSRKTIDEWTRWIKRPQIGAKGLVWVSQDLNGEFRSSVSKFFGLRDFSAWFEKAQGSKGDLLLMISGRKNDVYYQLGKLRIEIANHLQLIDPNLFVPLWVTDFPLFEWDDQENKYSPMHHPFTAPMEKDLSYLQNDPLKVRAQSYDLVLNGNEIGGGSVRILDAGLQLKILNLLNFTESDAQDRFGFLLDALKYGAPPHGGIAWGIDRLAAVLKGKESIRDFIAFPKNNRARDLMMGAPSALTAKQLKELQ